MEIIVKRNKFVLQLNGYKVSEKTFETQNIKMRYFGEHDIGISEPTGQKRAR